MREGRGGRVSEKGGKGRVDDLVEKQGYSTVQYSTVQHSIMHSSKLHYIVEQ